MFEAGSDILAFVSSAFFASALPVPYVRAVTGAVPDGYPQTAATSEHLAMILLQHITVPLETEQTHSVRLLFNLHMTLPGLS